MNTSKNYWGMYGYGYRDSNWNLYLYRSDDLILARIKNKDKTYDVELVGRNSSFSSDRPNGFCILENITLREWEGFLEKANDDKEFLNQLFWNMEIEFSWIDNDY